MGGPATSSPLLLALPMPPSPSRQHLPARTPPAALFCSTLVADELRRPLPRALTAVLLPSPATRSLAVRHSAAAVLTPRPTLARADARRTSTVLHKTPTA